MIRVCFSICDDHKILNEETEEVMDLDETCILLSRLYTENRLLKLAYGKCRDCWYANMYIPDYTYPFADPKCALGIKKIHSDSNACEEFKPVGRFSR